MQLVWPTTFAQTLAHRSSYPDKQEQTSVAKKPTVSIDRYKRVNMGYLISQLQEINFQPIQAMQVRRRSLSEEQH
jgi:hypothetical protein